MFNGYPNVQLRGKRFKYHYPKLMVMHGIEHTVSLFFNDIVKITILNQMVIDHKPIYKSVGSSIYHNPH